MVVGAGVWYLSKEQSSKLIQVPADPIPLPPDPGEAGKQTLAGIDSDGDGVRDDIQRYIALNYPDSEKTRAALTQTTCAMQGALLDADNEQASINHVIEDFAAGDCLSYIKGTKDAWLIFAALRARILNTKDRSLAYVRATQHFSGHEITNTPATELKLGCTFNPDLMRN